MRRLVLAMMALATMTGLLSAPASTSAASPSAASSSTASPQDEEPFTFLSSPDFMNADVADLREYWNWRTTRRRWKRRFPNRRVPNSWNRHYAGAVDTVMEAFDREEPAAVLVAGDLVNGHWGRDKYRVGRRTVMTGIFGPTQTFRQKRKALNRAAKFYFSRYRRLFGSRGLALYPAVGDHEYGDNPWSGSRPVMSFKRRTIPDVRERFFRAFMAGRGYSRPTGPARRTAYATWLQPQAHDRPGVLLVSLDEFLRRKRRVVGRVDDRQLAWLTRVLEQADPADWVIVQAHLPIIPGVPSRGSSALCYQGGTRSALWRTMSRSGRVDLYLNGEVHADSRKHHGGVTQISHGSLFGFGIDTSFLVGDVYGDRLELTLKRLTAHAVRVDPRLYQVAPGSLPVWRKRVRLEPETRGTLTLDPVTGPVPDTATGRLKSYTGPGPCGTNYRSDF